ncbi:MAG: pyruvoyl-dependent arginine decarboxylase [Candidatus Aenigmatarchaeota archaeon]
MLYKIESKKLLPKKVVFTKGYGFDKYKLISFEKALRSAGIERFNLVKVSSILPKRIKIGGIKDLEKIEDGEIVFGVIAINYSKKDFFGSSIGYVFPKNKNIHGYLTEYEFNSKKDLSSEAEKIAIKLFKSKFPEEEIESSGYFGIFKKPKKNYYNCCVSAAIFIM